MPHAEVPQKRCYAPKTLFRASDSTYVQADMLTMGDYVRDREGAIVEVKWVCQHRHSKEEIVVLTTQTAQLLVTSFHRVVKKSDHGEVVVLAGDVNNGDWIIVGECPEQVSVQKRVVDTSTIEIEFENDASVETWIISDRGIVTKGCAIDELRNAPIQCKIEEEDEEEDGGRRRSRRSRSRYDKKMGEIRRAKSPGHEFT